MNANDRRISLPITPPIAAPRPSIDDLPAQMERMFAPDGLLVQSGRQHRPGQLVLARAIAQGFVERRCVMAEAATGLGKCLGAGTLVLRYDGRIVPVETIVVGDELMGPDSRPRRVLATNVGTGPLYRIIPVKGEPWVCNDNHILTLVASVGPRGVVDIPLVDYLKESRYQRQNLKLFQPERIDFVPSDTKLPISPYFLGVWLGDGSKHVHQNRTAARLSNTDELGLVAITKPDPEIEQCVRNEAARFGLEVSVSRNTSDCPTFKIVRAGGNGHGAGVSKHDRQNPLLEAMRALMVREIRVPEAYRFGSRTVRAEVLAGLLDTDGFLIPPGTGYEIVQKRLLIADDIAFLARSLGFKVTRTIKVVNGEQYHRLVLSGDSQHVPMRIPRKIARPRQQIKNPLRTGFSAEPIGDGRFFGFTLDGDGRFLLGDFTVTHNSIAYLAAAVLAASKGRRVCIAVGTNNLIEQIRRDIPEVMRVLGIPTDALEPTHIITAVLKGRTHYVCNKRMKRANEMVGARMQRLNHEELAQFRAVRDWHYADEDSNFDLTLHEQTLTSRVRGLITNDADGCRRDRKKGCDWNEDNGKESGEVRELRCPMLLARRNALKGKIIVTNFNVYLFNCKLRGGLMGEFDTVILDEGHEAPGKWRDFFSVTYSVRVFNDLIERVNDDTRLAEVAREILPALVDSVSEMDALLRSTAVDAMQQNPPLRDANEFEMLLDPYDDYRIRLLSIASRVYTACVQLVKAAIQVGIPLEIVEMDFDKRAVVKRLAEGLGGAFDGQQFVPGKHESNFAISLQYGPLNHERDPYVSLSVIPVHLGGYMRQTIHYSKVREAAIASANNDPALVSAAIQQHSLSTHSDANVIVVSATLTPDGTWDHPKHAFAMPTDTIYTQIGSPFDYEKNAIWYVPAEMPDSKSENRVAYNAAASARARELVSVMGGRTLILCSRRADMRVAADAIRGLGFNILMQDDAPARELTRRFKEDPTSCLIGSKTFGTGFDVPGDALQCVIIWSMPYGKPTAVDELLRQRIGRSKWMNGVYTPAALLDMRQWVGRPLRTATDIGVVAFLDQQKYSSLARQLHGAMPAGIPLARQIEQVQRFLAERRGQ